MLRMPMGNERDVHVCICSRSVAAEMLHAEPEF